MKMVEIDMSAQIRAVTKEHVHLVAICYLKWKCSKMHVFGKWVPSKKCGSSLDEEVVSRAIWIHCFLIRSEWNSVNRYKVSEKKNHRSFTPLHLTMETIWKSFTWTLIKQSQRRIIQSNKKQVFTFQSNLSFENCLILNLLTVRWTQPQSQIFAPVQIDDNIKSKRIESNRNPYATMCFVS